MAQPCRAGALARAHPAPAGDAATPCRRTRFVHRQRSRSRSRTASEPRAAPLPGRVADGLSRSGNSTDLAGYYGPMRRKPPLGWPEGTRLALQAVAAPSAILLVRAVGEGPGAYGIGDVAVSPARHFR
jgi:hypothetical protein